MTLRYRCVRRRSTPKISRSSTRALCRNWLIVTKRLKCRVWAIVRRGGCHAKCLAEVVEPRYEELFSLIANELRRSNFADIIAAGVVLTGGSSKMEGAVELAEEVFHMPVRLGMPQFVKGLGEVVRNPIHATGCGHPHIRQG